MKDTWRLICQSRQGCFTVRSALFKIARFSFRCMSMKTLMNRELSTVSQSLSLRKKKVIFFFFFLSHLALCAAPPTRTNYISVSISTSLLTLICCPYFVLSFFISHYHVMPRMKCLSVFVWHCVFLSYSTKTILIQKYFR